MSDDLAQLLRRIADHAVQYRASVQEGPQRPELAADEMRARFDAPVPERGAPVAEVIEDLIARAEGGLAAMAGPRFFGWVIGATEPAGMAADWLASAWGQNCANYLATPAASAVEEIAARWLLELMDLPRQASVGFVTGATMANFTGLAAARGEVLRRAGWDAEADGLFGAPPINVVLGEEAHSTVFSALKYLGLGTKRVVSVASDSEGRMKPNAFAAAIKPLSGPIIVIAQAGHINSGAFDPFAEIIPQAHAQGAWVHVDGAFGLWARAARDVAPATAGVEQADSWGVDGHKWLQTPHDCGYAIVRDATAHHRAMQIAASYLPARDGARHPADYVPELSRRARGFATWAMIRALGREGIAAMVSRHCALARRFAQRLGREGDIEIMNEVVLNQIAIRLGADLEPGAADALTQRTIENVQRGGECFVGGAEWHGRQIVRVSVISAGTTETDVDRSADAIVSAWRAVRGANS